MAGPEGGGGDLEVTPSGVDTFGVATYDNGAVFNSAAMAGFGDASVGLNGSPMGEAEYFRSRAVVNASAASAFISDVGLGFAVFGEAARHVAHVYETQDQANADSTDTIWNTFYPAPDSGQATVQDRNADGVPDAEQDDGGGIVDLPGAETPVVGDQGSPDPADYIPEPTEGQEAPAPEDLPPAPPIIAN